MLSRRDAVGSPTGEQVAEVAAAVPGAHRRRRSARRSGSSSSPWRAALTCTLPADVSAVPWRPRRVCITQSNWSTPSADGLDERRRVADAHQVARPVGRQVGEGRGERRQHLARGSPRPTARRCRSRRSRGRRCGRRSRPAAPRRVPPWTMPNSAWSVAPVGGAGPRRPTPRCARRPARSTSGGLGSGGHTSSTIWMSAPSSSCVGDRRLRREAVRRAVVDAAERDAVVVDLRLEREHLEAAGVGQRQAVPAGEARRGRRSGRRRRRPGAASGGTCCRARSRRRARRSRRR